MKTLEKIALVLFSNIILILSILMCILIFGWLELDLVNGIVEKALNTTVYANIILGMSVVFILLAIKCIFFDSDARENAKEKSGILLENDNGKLLISKDTLENLTNGVVKSFNNAESVLSKVVLGTDNLVRVYVTLFVTPDVVIKDLSNNLQIKIKEAIKNSLDLEVKEVNIKIKNITTKKEVTPKVTTEENNLK